MSIDWSPFFDSAQAVQPGLFKAGLTQAGAESKSAPWLGWDAWVSPFPQSQDLAKPDSELGL